MLGQKQEQALHSVFLYFRIYKEKGICALSYRIFAFLRFGKLLKSFLRFAPLYIWLLLKNL